MSVEISKNLILNKTITINIIRDNDISVKVATLIISNTNWIIITV